jgi:5-formyltetrahydrofolate cyclo-ligase
MKRTIRSGVLAKRKAQTKEEGEEKSRLIVQRLLGLKEYVDAKVIAVYLPVNGEVETAMVIHHANKAGKETCVPVVGEGGAMCLVLHEPSDELRKGKRKTPEPVGKPERQHVDMVVVPGVVFDKFGHRIGMGGGYYDRYLKDKKCVNVGVCFDFQLVEKIPSETHDVPMDIVITEREVIRIER